MMCPNCNQQVRDGAKFCSKCGAPMGQPTPGQQGQAGQPMQGQPMAGQPMQGQPMPGQPMQGQPMQGKPIQGQPMQGQHMQGQPMNYQAMGDMHNAPPKKAPVKLLIGIGVCVLIALAAGIYFGGGFNLGFGKGGASGDQAVNEGFYLKDYEIYSTNLPNGEPMQITEELFGDSEARDGFYPGKGSELVKVSKNGKYIFYPDNMRGSQDGSDLYYRQVGKEKFEPVKIDSAVSYCEINDAATIVTYYRNRSLYQYDMAKGEKEKIASGVSWTFHVNSAGTEVFYVDEKGTLYSKKTGEEKVKIDSEVSFIVEAYENGTAYYATSAEDAYEYRLYYYDGESKEKLASRLVIDGEEAPWAAKDKEVVAYKTFDGDDWEMSAHIAIKGTVTDIDADEGWLFAVRRDGKEVFYMDNVDSNWSEADLFRISIDGDVVNQPELYDTGVSIKEYLSVKLVGEKDVMYYKDEDSLYLNKEKIDSDAEMSYRNEEGAKIYTYLTDCDEYGEVGTLKKYENGQVEKIADDVKDYNVLSNGDILFVSDYSSNYNEGTLSLYSKGNVTKLEDEMTRIYYDMIY